MSLLVVGLNHRTAAVPIREAFAFAADRHARALSQLHKTVPECVLLSTCNRTEIYAAGSDNLLQPVLDFFRREAPELPMDASLYRHPDDAAARHLFRVASGLDSMVVGENEVLGQVKQAYLASHHVGATGKLLNVLFQRALYVGKRVRTETGLSLGSASVGSVAVTMAERIFGSLHGKTVLILGAGKMAELTAKYLLSQKVKALFVANRTYERAVELATAFDGHALSFDDGLIKMEDADIVICSTAAPHPVITTETVKDLMERRGGRSLFFIDIAMPRDVHPDVHGLDNVYVYNIDDLESIVHENRNQRAAEIGLAERIVEEKSAEFGHWLSAFHSGKEVAFKHSPKPSSDGP